MSRIKKQHLAYFSLIGYLLIITITACTSAQTPAPIIPTLTPINLSPHLNKAAQQVEAGHYSAALDTLEEAARLDLNSVQPSLAKGEIYLKQHRWASAQYAFEYVLENQPHNYTATLGLAEAYLNQEAYAKSEKMWQQAIELKPTHPEAWYGLGQIYLTKHKYPQAKESLAQAVAYGGNWRATWLLIGLTIPTDFETGLALLNHLSDQPDIQEYLLTALKPFNPQSPPAEIATITGIAMLQLEEWELAHYALSTATELDPTHTQAWVFLGHVQAHLNLPAMASFEQARKLEPTLALIPYFEGLYFREKGLYNAAIDRFFEALELDPGNKGVALETAYTLAEKGDYLSAEFWYRLIIKGAPDSAEYQRALTAFFIERNYRAADVGLLEAERLLELAPEDVRTFDLLGRAKFLAADYTGAEAALRQAIALDPTYVPAHYHLGRLLEVLQRYVEAQAEFTYVIDWDKSGTYRNNILKGTQ